MLRVAAVGAGYFSQFQYAGWRDIESAETVALADLDAEKARRATGERSGDSLSGEGQWTTLGSGDCSSLPPEL